MAGTQDFDPNLSGQNSSMCSQGTYVLVLGLVIAVLSCLLFLMAIASASNGVDGIIVVGPQILGMIVDSTMAAIGYYVRRLHCR